MGRIFKTPKDDSVEETLRAMHLANTVDNTYEWGVGWLRTLLAAVISALIVSYIESVSNFTLWLSVHLAQEYNPKLRVNAIAPGFFLTKQNHFLLIDEKTGELTPRGDRIIANTPMGTFGNPEDLIGTALWLATDASRFVTGIVVPVDGGFSAFSGV